MTARILKLLLASAFLLALPALAQAACTPSDIAVDKLNGRVDGDYIYITGRLVNNCASATGVQIKVTIYNKAGDILAANDSWPASINNIPARSDFPFQQGMDRRPGFAKFDVRVIATKTR
jgi:hypothetical protein